MKEEYLNEFIVSGGAQRRAIRAADFHPPDVRRFAPGISVCSGRYRPASKLVASPAADPQLCYVSLRVVSIGFN